MPSPPGGSWVGPSMDPIPGLERSAMLSVTILTEAEIRSCVGMDSSALSAVAGGFTRLSEGQATLPPVIRIDIPQSQGEVDIKTAYIHGLDRFAIKVASGFLNNPSLGLAYGSGMMIVMSARTGFLEAILLDNGYLTDLRTGLAGGIAAQYLARASIETAGVIGSGMQARYQIRALRLVRDFQRLLVYSRTPDHVRRYAQEMEQELGLEVLTASNPEEVVRHSDVVVTTTPSHEPYLKAEWLHPGLHITCMGSDAEQKQELFAQALGRADRLVCDRRSQCFLLGELHHALDEGVISRDDDIAELGDLTAGRRSGRQSDQEITICDLTGVGVQDTAIALLAYERALAKGLGASIAV
jgi:ectoine utilization protein EutC